MGKFVLYFNIYVWTEQEDEWVIYIKFWFRDASRPTTHFPKDTILNTEFLNQEALLNWQGRYGIIN